MATSSSSDLLGAASLALGALSIFYSLWSSDLENAINIQKRVHLDSRGPDIEKVKKVLKTRGLPLVVAASLLSVLLAPPVLGILKISLTEILKKNIHAFHEYDAVPALLVAVWLVLIFLVYLNASVVLKMRRKINELEQIDPDHD